MTETAKLATVILPASSFLEKSGTFTNGERRIQRVQQVVEPIEGTKSDGQIMVDIMNRYGKIMTYRKLQAIENNQRGELLGREMAALRLAFPEDVDDRFFFGPLPEPDSKQ